MEKFVITGGKALHGQIRLGGAKNVALKVLVAALLTDEAIRIHNLPLLRDVFFMLEVLEGLGLTYKLRGHTVTIQNKGIKSTKVPLEVGASLRTSSMVVGPLLARYGQATIPNPGGCRLGARPIDRHMEALERMGAQIKYHSDDGYFYLSANKLTGTRIAFPKNTHTGTETIILAAVLAQGTTILQNAAEEVEIDELITLLNRMGAKIVRSAHREITVEGVSALHGAEYSVESDRNEEVTFAIAAAVTGGDIVVKASRRSSLEAFLTVFRRAGGQYEEIDATTTRYFSSKELHATDTMTGPYPGFMTDWQAPWAVFMTQVTGESSIHETVFESRFSYVGELKKMGAMIDFYDPQVDNPKEFYNFNWRDRVNGYHQGIKIYGPTELHNAVLSINDLRAGATLVLAALVAAGESYIHGVEQIDRGYEQIETKLTSLGANIRRIKEEV